MPLPPTMMSGDTMIYRLREARPTLGRPKAQADSFPELPLMTLPREWPPVTPARFPRDPPWWEFPLRVVSLQAPQVHRPSRLLWSYRRPTTVPIPSTWCVHTVSARSGPAQSQSQVSWHGYWPESSALSGCGLVPASPAASNLWTLSLTNAHRASIFWDDTKEGYKDPLLTHPTN